MITFRHVAVSICLCSLIIVFALPAVAQTVTPPQNLKAFWSPTGTQSQNYVTIDWTNSYIGTWAVFIYWAYGAVTAGDSSAAWHGGVYAMSGDTVVADMRNDLGLAGAQTISFKAFATRYNFPDSVNSAWSNIAVAKFPPGNDSTGIRFTTTPPTVAYVNEQYVYYANATPADQSHPLTYDFVTFPYGMSVDSAGTVTYTPTSVETDSVILRASDALNRQQVQSWVINVTTRDTTPGTLSGTILDASTHAAIGGATVSVVRVAAAGDSSAQNDPNYGSVNVTSSNSNGRSYSTLYAGTYAVYVSAAGYIGMWADSANSIESANRFAIVSNGTSPFTISLHPTPAGTCTLQGTVRNASGPVTTAHVSVVGLSGGGIANDNTYHNDVTVAGDGSYTINVPHGDSIIIAAYAPGYVEQYWSDALSPFDATRLSTDSTAITADFILSATAGGGVSASGTVASCDPSIHLGATTVVFYRLVDSSYTSVNSASADSTGKYSVAGLAAGYYIAKAMPNSNTSAPGYYSLTHPCSFLWSDATSIRIDSSNVSGIDITIPSSDTSDGFAIISGQVTVPSGAPNVVYLSGACVIATNARGVVDGYAYSNQNGEYTITNVPKGVHTLSLDKVDYSSTGAANLTSDYDSHGKLTANLTASRVTATRVNEAPLSFAVPVLSQNYPNPFSPQSTISFSLPVASHVDLSIYDLTGRRVATVVHEQLLSGPHSIEVDASQLPVGSYIYRLQTPTTQVSKRMTVMR